MLPLTKKYQLFLSTTLLLTHVFVDATSIPKTQVEAPAMNATSLAHNPKMNQTSDAMVGASNTSQAQVEPPAMNATGLIHPPKMNHTNNATAGASNIPQTHPAMNATGLAHNPKMNHTNNATVDSNISRTQVEPPAVNPTGLIHPQKLNHTNNATEVPYTIGGGGVFNEPLFREYPTYDKYRGAWTRSAIKARNDLDPTFNYVVCSRAQAHEVQWAGNKSVDYEKEGKKESEADYQHPANFDWSHGYEEISFNHTEVIGFDIYRARSGNFTLKGYGGWQNWAWFGQIVNKSADGKTLTFGVRTDGRAPK